jgi:alanine racemase
MTVDVTDLNRMEINVGDFIELIGDNISINEIAEKSNTIPYEILNNIGFRAKKIYID